MDYTKAVEKISESHQLKNNYQQAMFIGITAADLERIKEGKGSPVAKLKIMDKLGYAWAKDALKSVMTESAYAKYLALDERLTKKKVQQGAVKNSK